MNINASYERKNILWLNLLNITFDYFIIRLLGYMIEVSCLYIP